MPDRTYAKGEITGLAIAIGAAVGVPLGLAFDNPAFIGVGVGIGVAVGVAIGAAIERRYEKAGRVRPLTHEEKVRGRRFALAGLVAAAIVAVLIVSLTAD